MFPPFCFSWLAIGLASDESHMSRTTVWIFLVLDQMGAWGQGSSLLLSPISQAKEKAQNRLPLGGGCLRGESHAQKGKKSHSKLWTTEEEGSGLKTEREGGLSHPP